MSVTCNNEQYGKVNFLLKCWYSLNKMGYLPCSGTHPDATVKTSRGQIMRFSKVGVSPKPRNTSLILATLIIKRRRWLVGTRERAIAASVSSVNNLFCTYFLVVLICTSFGTHHFIFDFLISNRFLPQSYTFFLLYVYSKFPIKVFTVYLNLGLLLMIN